MTEKKNIWDRQPLWMKWTIRIASTIVALGVIWKFLLSTSTSIVGGVNQYVETKNEVDTLQKKFAQYQILMESKIKSQNNRIDSIIKYHEAYDESHIVTLSSILASQLDDKKINGVLFKEDANNRIYYFVDGILYPTIRDANSGNFYYLDDDGHTYFCR